MTEHAATGEQQTALKRLIEIRKEEVFRNFGASEMMCMPELRVINTYELKRKR